MQGYYVTGQGKAHQCCRPHTAVFGCRMYGTFNVQVPGFRVGSKAPTVTRGEKNYWFVVLVDTSTKQDYPCWAIRDTNSNQRQNTLELLTRELLPERLKTTLLDVSFPQRWDSTRINEWATNKYWFQTFSFSPRKRANSEFLWNAVNAVNWSNERVLDYGCHYGYFSFEASKRGACVTGADSNIASLETARTIRDHILQQDVRFVRMTSLPREKNTYDVVLYLSVLHQIDPTYVSLPEMLERLRQLARKTAFVELIMPPCFPLKSKRTEREIDDTVNGNVVLRYKHAVRGYRKLYRLDAI